MRASIRKRAATPIRLGDYLAAKAVAEPEAGPVAKDGGNEAG